MSFHIKDRPLGAEFSRIACSQLDAAIGQLERDGVDATAIHDARKSIKKVRAILKLLRVPLGNRYTKANDRLRAAGRRLGRVRDVDALPDTLRLLRTRHPEVITAATARRVARGLHRHRRHVRAGARSAVSRAVTLLKQTRRNLPGELEAIEDFAEVKDGLRRAYGRARSALSDLTLLSGDLEFHDWRRRLKEHWYQIRLLEARHPTPRARARSLKSLETALGDDHNLVVLSEMLLAHPRRSGGARTTALLLGCIQTHQRGVRRRALARGRRLFAMTPKEFAAMVVRWWHRSKRG